MPSNEEVNELECVDLTRTILTFQSPPFASSPLMQSFLWPKVNPCSDGLRL